MITLLAHLKGTILHPQWLSDRYHFKARSLLSELRNKLILDVGSGHGGYLKHLADDNNLISLDYPETNTRYSERPDVYGTASRLPFDSDSIDVILFLEVFEHVKNGELAIAEINRVLKKDGILYFSAPFIYPAHDVPFDYKRMTIYGFRDLLKDSGFKINREIQNGNSIIVSMQLFNLAILESVSKILKMNRLAGIIFGVLAYPLCILINIMALLFLKLDCLDRASFGYLIVAKADK